MLTKCSQNSTVHEVQGGGEQTIVVIRQLGTTLTNSGEEEEKQTEKNQK